MNSNFRNFALWVIIGLLLIALFNLFQNGGQRSRANEIPFSQLLSDVDQGRVREVTIAGHQVTGKYTSGTSFQTYAPDDADLVSRLADKGVTINAKPPTDGTMTLFGVLIQWFPMLLLIGGVDLFYASDAVRWRQSDGLRQVQGQASDGAATAA